MSRTILDRENWMSGLDPNKRVIDSYIPASHDASAYTSSVRGTQFSSPLSLFANALGAVTQSEDYYGQLCAGSRYFDMRIKWNTDIFGFQIPGIPANLVMKHGDITFQPFLLVLQQIKRWADRHPKEYLFLDLDFKKEDKALSDAILKALVTVLGNGSESVFSTKHTDANQFFNTQLTWRDLFDDHGKQFVIIWQEEVNSGKVWAPKADNIRDNFEKDFNKKQPHEIRDSLQGALDTWNGSRRKLFLTQLINTPNFSPISHPVELDLKAAPIFNPWIMGKHPGDALCVVKRDFVNSSWNQEAIEHVIRLNSFTSGGPPMVTIGAPIQYQNLIRLKVKGGKYVGVVHQSPLSYLRLVDHPDEQTDFCVRLAFEFNNNEGWSFSGNQYADTISAHGAFRLVHTKASLPFKDFVLSMDKKNDCRVFWGVGKVPAAKSETWLAYDACHYANTGQIYSGTSIVIRSLSNRYWMVNQDGTIGAATEKLDKATEFIVEQIPPV